MKSFPLDVLAEQSDPGRLPLAYLLRVALPVEVSADELFACVIRSLIEPVTPKQLRAELLATGNYAGLLHGLESGRFSAMFASAELERLRTQIDRHIRRLAEKMLAGIALCRVRYDRLGPSAVPFFDGKIQAASECATLKSADPAALQEGSEIVARLNEELAAAEERELASLSKWLKSLPQSEGEPIALSVARAIREREIARARDLLQSLESGGGSLPATAIPYRNSITDPAPVRTIISWMKKGVSSERPHGFVERWGPRPGDSVGESLFAAIERLVLSPPESVTVHFSHMVSALEQVLGVETFDHASARALSRRGNRLSTTLRGLRREGLYAFDAAAYDAGVPIEYFVPGESASSDDNDPDEGDEAPVESGNEQLSDSDVVADATWSYRIALGDIPAIARQERQVRLEWRSLLSLVGDSHRGHNLSRLINRQIEPADAFPDADRRARALSILVGREHVVDEMIDTEGPAVWIGPRGCGKSAALAGAESRARAMGRGVLRLKSPADVERATEQLASHRLVEWYDPARESGVLVTVDDVGDLNAASDSGVGLRAALLLQTIRDMGDPCVTAAGTADVHFAAVHPGGSWRRLPPLRFMETRAVVERLLDLTGRLADPLAIDHMAYFAGGHPRVLHYLLRRCTSRATTTGTGRIAADRLRALLDEPDFRRSAREILISPLDDMPRLVSAAFATIWCAPNRRDRTKGMTSEEVRAALSAYIPLAPTTKQVEEAMACLEASYLLEHRDGWHLIDGGLGMLLVDTDIESRVLGWLE